MASGEEGTGEGGGGGGGSSGGEGGGGEGEEEEEGALDIPLLIRSPGMELRAESECRDVTIEIEGVGFLANLILLNSASLDVILGMDWLSQHQGHIDCAKKVVYLTSSSGEQIGFSPKLQGPHLFALEAKPTPQLSEIPICSPEELVR